MTRASRRGAIADRLWEIEGGSAPAIARRVRALALEIVVLRLSRDERALVPDGSRSRLDEAAATLRASGIELWGLGALGAGPLPAAASLTRDLAESLQLSAWIVEPAPAGDTAALAEHLRLLRTMLGDRQLGLMHPGPDAGRFSELLDSVDLRLPRLGGGGSIGLAVAAGSAEPALVPVLALSEALRRPGDGAEADLDLVSQVNSFQASAARLGIGRIVLDGWDLLPAKLSLPDSNLPPAETIEEEPL
jgi:hypothetical protein